MKDLDGVTNAEMTISDAEFEAAGGIVRVIDGAIVLGKTDAETQAEQNEARKAGIAILLSEIDSKSSRASRSVALAVAEGQTPNEADVTRLQEMEAEARALRAELSGL